MPAIRGCGQNATDTNGYIFVYVFWTRRRNRGHLAGEAQVWVVDQVLN